MEELDKEALRRRVLEGYAHLAFGPVDGPVRLLVAEKPGERAIRNMDLFRVSEIKTVKGGGTEIKFYDRMAALQAMLAFCEEDQAGILRALEQGALALRGIREGEDQPCVS